MHVHKMSIALSECLPGFYGSDCSETCRYPNYGYGCQQKCHCSEIICNSAKGCRSRELGKHSVNIIHDINYFKANIMFCIPLKILYGNYLLSCFNVINIQS